MKWEHDQQTQPRAPPLWLYSSLSFLLHNLWHDRRSAVRQQCWYKLLTSRLLCSFDVSTLNGYVQIRDEVRVWLFVCWSLMSTRLSVEISAWPVQKCEKRKALLYQTCLLLDGFNARGLSAIDRYWWTGLMMLISCQHSKCILENYWYKALVCWMIFPVLFLENCCKCFMRNPASFTTTKNK